MERSRTRKLTLEKETLRALGARQLRQVGGASGEDCGLSWRICVSRPICFPTIPL